LQEKNGIGEEKGVERMEKGDLVNIEFTGKKTEDGKIFDTTDEIKAKEAGIFDEQKKYAPMVVLIGSGELIKGFHEALRTMKAGESKTITLEPRQAFGERSADLVKVIPLQEFKNHHVPAVPGTIVNANNMTGKVQSVSGGRVRVDFNHELAGKQVEFEIKIVKQFTDANEQLTVLAKKAFPNWEKPDVKIEGKTVTLNVPAERLQRVQPVMAGFSKMVLDTLKAEKVLVQIEFEQKNFTEHTHQHN
jgi:FKBP-type peptidyl-prolyl cis-trans isomerase 2